MERLAAYPEMRYFAGLAYILHGNAAVLRGGLALRLDDAVDEAERHFRTGLEWASRPDVRFVIDQGHQGLAEVVERRGDAESARTHLDAAGALFAKHGAKLYVDQVLAKKEFLKA